MAAPIEARHAIAGLTLSAIGFVAIATSEGYAPNGRDHIPGDVPTLGFGMTIGVKATDTTTPVRAMQVLLGTENKFEKAVKQCIKAPLYQYEFDAYMDFAYNLGPATLCRSSIVKDLNAGDYAGACRGLLLYDEFHGHPLAGLEARREREFKTCTTGAPLVALN